VSVLPAVLGKKEVIGRAESFAAANPKEAFLGVA
jgi:hypothetical protein